LAVQRYRIIAAGTIADAGRRPFESVSLAAAASLSFVSTTVGARPENAAIRHWYRYNLLTHLLETDGHIYVVRSRNGRMWKLDVLSYYCPRLTAGCLTLRYAPVGQYSSVPTDGGPHPEAAR
jgi:hypothetical protein